MFLCCTLVRAERLVKSQAAYCIWMIYVYLKSHRHRPTSYSQICQPHDDDVTNQAFEVSAGIVICMAMGMSIFYRQYYCNL